MNSHFECVHVHSVQTFVCLFQCHKPCLAIWTEQNGENRENKKGDSKEQESFFHDSKEQEACSSVNQKKKKNENLPEGMTRRQADGLWTVTRAWLFQYLNESG